MLAATGRRMLHMTYRGVDAVAHLSASSHRRMVTTTLRRAGNAKAGHGGLRRAALGALLAASSVAVGCVAVASVGRAQGTPPPPIGCGSSPCPTYFPTVTFAPSSRTITTGQMVAVTITACDSGSTTSESISAITQNGTNVTTHFDIIGGAAGSGPGGSCTALITATGTVSLGSGTTAVQATVIGVNSLNRDTTVGAGIYVYAPGTVGLTVVPHLALITVPHSTGGTASFTVKNTGTATDTVTLGALCGGAATGCAVSGTNPVVINAGDTTTGTLTFTGSSAAGAGDVRLGATKSSAPSASDTGETDITVTTLVAHGIQLNPVYPGSLREGGYCINVALRRGASVSCGDFRYAHALPVTKTFNRTRQPVLVYSSQTAHPFILVPALVTADTSHGTIDSVVVQLKSAGTVIDHVKLAGASFAHGITERVVVGANEEAAGSSIVSIVVTAATYSGVNVTNDSISGATEIESAHFSHLGRGWLLGGLEQLKFYGTGASAALFWTTGGGDVRYYQPTATRWLWRTDSLDRRDSVTYDSTKKTYTRHAEHGAQVVFDSLGRHTMTVNRLADTTKFAYTSATSTDIASLTLPDPAGDNTYQYQFTYDSAHSDYLQSVTAPGPTGARRTVTFSQNGSGQITGIQDPDGFSDSFQYSPASQFQTLISSFRDKRGIWTTIAYDSGLKVRTAVLDTVGLKVTETLIAQQSRGLNSVLAPDSAYSEAIDPLGHIRRVWLDRFGAPLRIRDAVGNVTLITRASSAYPGLATRLRKANGQILGATYDARGNVASITDSSTAVSGAYATTSFQWDGQWDIDTLTTSPLRIH